MTSQSPRQAQIEQVRDQGYAVIPQFVPQGELAKLNAAAVAALADAATRRRLDDLGQEIPPREQQTPQALGAFHRSEIDKWWPIIKAAGIKPE